MIRRKPVVGETIRVLPEEETAYKAKVYDLLSVQFTAYRMGVKVPNPTFLFYDPLKGTDWEYMT